MALPNLSCADIFVTYKTSHPSGHYYIGKSSLRRISAGYSGSGPRLKAAFLHPGFEPNTWKTEIINTHQSETIAYLAEAKLVPLELLSDPYCLNTQPGGNIRFYGSPYAKLLKKTRVAKKATKVVKAKDGTITIKRGTK